MKTTLRNLLGATLIGSALLAGHAPAQTPLHAEFGDAGLSALKWGEHDLLKDPAPRVNKIILERKTLNDQGLNEFDFETLEGGDPEFVFDKDKKKLTAAYPWGGVDVRYDVKADRLDMTVTIRNDSERTLAMFDLTPLSLALPDPVDRPKRWDGLTTMPGRFNAVQATAGDRLLMLGATTVMPLRFGFDKPTDKNKTLPLRIRGNVNMLEPGGVVYHHFGLPRIAPGKSLDIDLSLRVAPADADRDKLRADFVDAFRDFHRPALVWKDRRPIGALFIGNGYGPPNNPRNWFKDAKLDVRTEQGRAELRERMMAHAERCIKVLKSTNAQGMVLWDPEGGENPHPTTYIGDPRMVPLVAPEMADIYPDYFKKFTDAGLRAGVCIRPSQVYMTPYTHACDGDLQTRWSVRKFPQWIEIDLGAEHRIDRAQLVCHADRAYQYKIEARTKDGEYALVVDRTENKTPGKADEPIVDSFDPVEARFVRLTITGAHEYGGEWCSIREFRLFAGKSKNLALNNAHDRSRSFGRPAGGHVYHFDPDRNPLNDDFSDIRPRGLADRRFFPIVERMSRKIEFAKKNWGCTLFYIDTNGVQRPVGQDQRIKWTLLDNHIWRDLQKRHPDVLLIPEFAPNPGQLAYTTTYLQPPYSPPVLRDRWRDLLPGAFGVSYTVNLGFEDWKKLRPRLIHGIKAGDSMFFRGWFGDRYNKEIKALYDEVYEPDAVNPGLPESYLNPAD